ncbi:MAG TPA: hypothetical protein VMT86_01425 [Bryobacteraceae bacterium]|nr:hypothetical protein [Bryobacteraceae bacterium]
MGYEVYLPKSSETYLLNCADVGAKLALRDFWQQVSIKQASLQSLYYRQVAEEPCCQLVRHQALNYGLRPSEDHASDPKTFTITTADGNWGITVLVRRTGGAVEDKRCTSCGVPMLENHNFMGLSYTRAHNVIPSHAWKKIVPRAIVALLRDIHADHRLIEAYDDLGILMQHASRGSTPEFETPDWFGHGVDNSAAGALVRQKLTAADWAAMRSLRMSGERASSAGATNYEGAQCAVCEKIHDSLSLIQRLTVASVNTSMERQLVSREFRVDPNPGGQPRTPLEIARAHTELVAQRVLLQMLSELEGHPNSWLAATILTYWTRWQRFVKDEAVAVCSVNVDAKEEGERILSLGYRKANA